MIYTNIHNLPDRVIKQLPLPRKPEERILHVTELLSSPREHTLLLEHWDDLEVDFSVFLDTLLGTALHKYQESLNKQRSEIKLSGKIGQFTIVGTADSYDPDTKTLRDTKVRPVGTLKYPSFKEDLAKQLNCYSYFLSQTDLEIKHLEADVYYRDWKHWESNKSNKVRYAVMKKGRKTALKVFDTLNELYSWCEEQEICGTTRSDDNFDPPEFTMKKEYSIEERGGDENYPVISVDHSVPIELWTPEIQKEWLEDTCELFSLDKMYCDNTYRWKNDLKCREFCSVRSICKYALNNQENNM